MNRKRPTVSIGMPLYNAERYVAQAIESILGQTFSDFELLISDNASTDKTGEICQHFVQTDPRVKYFKNETNLGAAKNFNNVCDLACGKYFKWASYDDLLAPEFLGSCVDVLDSDEGTVLCYTAAIQIDALGEEIKRYRADLSNVSAEKAELRYSDLIRDEYNCLPVFGLIRAEPLKKTPLIGPYIGSDRVLLAELGLHGKFIELEQSLFFHREHNARSTRAIPLHERAAWFDPKRAKSVVLPYWRYLKEYISSVRRSPLSWRGRWLCYREVVRWVRWYYKKLLGDLTMAARQATGKR